MTRMTQSGAFRWAARLAACMVVLALALPCAAKSGANRADSQRRAFVVKLQKFAEAKGGSAQPAYFAILRRGMDRYEELQRQSPRRAPQVNFAALSATPDAVDQDRRGQLLTLMRLDIRSPIRARILGGWKVEAGEFDEAVMVVGNGFLCSGVALNSTTVLTAAHCACDMHLAQSDGLNVDENKNVWVGLSKSAGVPRFPVDLGKTVFMANDLSGIVPCPDVLPSVIAGNPDLALVRLQSGSQMTVPTIGIASVDLFNQTINKGLFYVVGFGCTAPIQSNGVFQSCSQSSSGAKFAAVINTSGQCTRTGPNGCSPGNREFVLRDSRRMVDTCAGDSGGPVILFSGAGFFLAGITSRAVDPGGACGPGGIYENVSTTEVVNWLKRHVSEP